MLYLGQDQQVFSTLAENVSGLETNVATTSKDCKLNYIAFLFLGLDIL